MLTLNQKGFAQVFVLLLLLTGLGISTYLVQQKTNLFSRAATNKQVNNNPTQKEFINSLLAEEKKVAGIEPNGKLEQERAESLAELDPEGFQQLVKQGLVENPDEISKSVNLRRESLSKIPAMPRITSTAVTSCGEITSSGDYFLTKDLVNDGGVCINIHDVENVNLDCQNYSIITNYNANIPPYGIAMMIKNAQKFSVKNCSPIRSFFRSDKYKYISTPSIHIENSNFGSLLNNTVEDGHVKVFDSNNLKFSNNTVNTFYFQVRSSLNEISGNKFKLYPGDAAHYVAYVVSLADGKNNTIADNTIDGGWDGIDPPQTGADDGIAIFGESQDNILGNTVINNYDCGIETFGLIQNTQITNNRINNNGLCGIGGWHNNSWLNNIVDSNTVNNSAYMFYFFLYNYYSSSKKHQFVYFKDNMFSNNTFLNQRNASYIGPTKPYSSLIDFQNIPSDKTSMSPSKLQLGNNKFKNNDFNVAIPSPILIPTYMVVDQGGNKCLPGSDNSIWQLKCGTATSTPSASPSATPKPIPNRFRR